MFTPELDEEGLKQIEEDLITAECVTDPDHIWEIAKNIPLLIAEIRRFRASMEERLSHVILEQVRSRK